MKVKKGESEQLIKLGQSEGVEDHKLNMKRLTHISIFLQIKNKAIAFQLKVCSSIAILFILQRK